MLQPIPSLLVVADPLPSLVVVADQVAVLALLVKGPYPADEIAEHAGCSTATMGGELAQLQAAGMVKRVRLRGARCWALLSYQVPPPGPRPSAKAPVVRGAAIRETTRSRRATILSVLKRGPQTCATLQQRLHLDNGSIVRRLLGECLANHEVKRIGHARSTRWALIGWVAPKAKPTARKWNGDRFPVDRSRPTVAVPLVDPVSGESWWMKPLSYEGFTKTAAARQPAMSDRRTRTREGA